jgi:hypothetical protein
MITVFIALRSLVKSVVREAMPGKWQARLD